MKLVSSEVNYGGMFASKSTALQRKEKTALVNRMKSGVRETVMEIFGVLNL